MAESWCAAPLNFERGAWNLHYTIHSAHDGHAVAPFFHFTISSFSSALTSPHQSITTRRFSFSSGLVAAAAAAASDYLPTRTAEITPSPRSHLNSVLQLDSHR